jgi:hypothetical protein
MTCGWCGEKGACSTSTIPIGLRASAQLYCTGKRLHPLPWALPVRLRVHGRYSRAEIDAAHCCAEAWRLRDPARGHPLDPPRRRAPARTQPTSPPPPAPATWPLVTPWCTGRARAPSTTANAAHGCCCLCTSNGARAGGLVASPNRSCASALAPTRVTRKSRGRAAHSVCPLQPSAF